MDGGFESLPSNFSTFLRTSAPIGAWETSGTIDVTCGLWENQEGDVSVELAGRSAIASVVGCHGGGSISSSDRAGPPFSACLALLERIESPAVLDASGRL